MTNVCTIWCLRLKGGTIPNLTMILARATLFVISLTIDAFGFPIALNQKKVTWRSEPRKRRTECSSIWSPIHRVLSNLWSLMTCLWLAYLVLNSDMAIKRRKIANWHTSSPIRPAHTIVLVSAMFLCPTFLEDQTEAIPSACIVCLSLHARMRTALRPLQILMTNHMSRSGPRESSSFS